MLSTLLVIGGVVVGLVLLLVLIVSLSARTARTARTARSTRGPDAARTPGWVVDSGREHPDAWAPLSQTSTEIRAIR
jgi:hypothetical protein